MKKFTLVLCMAILSLTISAQPWKAKIETKTIKGNYITKNLVMRTNHGILIMKIADPPYNRLIRYSGRFLGGSSDSIRISLEATHSELGLSKSLKGMNFPRSGIEDYKKGNISIALSDVGYINYAGLTENAEDYITGGVMLGIMGSLAVLIITPLFCINYNDFTFNGDRYKKWAIGGGSGLASSLTVLFIAIKIDNKEFNFKLDIPGKKVKIWNFKYD